MAEIVYDFDQAGYLYALQVASCSFIFFTAIYFISAFLSDRSFKSYQNLNDGHKREWNCRVVAFLHSVIAVLGASYAILTFPLETSSLGMDLCSLFVQN